LAGGAVLTVFANGHYRIAVGQAPVVYTLRILHTNDHHARIEPANVTLQSTPTTVTRNFGGVARRKTLVDQLRATPGADDLFLLDAGDIFQGTLYFNLYSGVADKSFYNQLNYDVVAVGNHEFDKGQATLRDFINGIPAQTPPNPPINFPMVSANITVDAAAPLAAALAPTDVAVAGKLGKRLIVNKGGPTSRAIGIFGLTPPDTGILSNPGAGVTFGTDVVAIAQAQVDALKAAGAQHVIGLTHVGYPVDQQIAAGVRGINVIVGGHSHTPLLPLVNPPSPVGVASQGPYPTIVNDPDGKPVVITTDWEWGKWLGDITVGFDATGLVSVISGVIRPVWADGLGSPPRALLPGEQPEIAPDATFQTEINTVWKPGVDALSNQQIGSTAVFLDGERLTVRNRETNLGNLIADAMLEKTKAAGAQLCITNGGGIRASIPGPAGGAATDPVTVGEVLTVLPFGNTLALVTITGAQVIAALENGVSQVNLANPSSSAGRFPQVGGLRFIWDPIRPVGSRIVSVLVETTPAHGTVAQRAAAFTPINPTASYRVVTNNFMLTGGDGYSVFTQGTNGVDTGFIMADEVQNYITANSPVNRGTEGRITRAQWWFPFIPRQESVAAPAYRGN
jgi:5'-nucleotidase